MAQVDGDSNLDKGRVLDQEQKDKIYTAARHDDLDTLEKMNSSGVIVTNNLVNGTALHVAAACGNTSVVSALLNWEVDVDAVDCEGYTALHYAAKCGYVDIVEALLRYSANIDMKENWGRTAFQLAVQNYRSDVVHYFVHNTAVDPSQYSQV
ncbi:uncharacterized protein [Dysidea avara]|uniref:uncharacterized protein n=1 Tax=Dysidea avara TaxID=196820 RepID=UPI003325CFC9